MIAVGITNLTLPKFESDVVVVTASYGSWKADLIVIPRNGRVAILLSKRSERNVQTHRESTVEERFARLVH